MQKAATDNVICIACGADVRNEALFCYNCGGAIAAKMESDAVAPSPDLHVELESEPMDSSLQAEKAVSTEAPAAVSSNGAAAKPERKPLSAAMLRRKRAYNRQPVEVVWNEPGKPSVTFVLTSVVVAVFAALILAAALYLK